MKRTHVHESPFTENARGSGARRLSTRTDVTDETDTKQAAAEPCCEHGAGWNGNSDDKPRPRRGREASEGRRGGAETKQHKKCATKRDGGWGRKNESERGER